jgi:predicted nucleotidyltransferase
MINIRSKAAQAALSYFFLHEGTEMYVNELARRIGQESGNLTRKLKELERDGLLKSDLRGNQKYYSLNPSFPLISEYRQIILKSVGLEHLLQEAVRSVSGVEKALLFGSYAENRMDMASDIDLLVVGKHNALDLQRAIARVQKTTNREINAVNLTPSEYEKRRKNDLFVKSLHHKPHISLL